MLGDVAILNMDCLLWASVKVFGEAPSPRAQFMSTIHKDLLYVFGGLNGKAFCPSEMWVLELDLSRAARRVA
jgi:hypothetical protein